MCTCAYAYIVISTQLGMMLLCGDHRNTQSDGNRERTFKDNLVFHSVKVNNRLSVSFLTNGCIILKNFPVLLFQFVKCKII